MKINYTIPWTVMFLFILKSLFLPQITDSNTERQDPKTTQEKVIMSSLG